MILVVIPVERLREKEGERKMETKREIGHLIKRAGAD